MVQALRSSLDSKARAGGSGSKDPPPSEATIREQIQTLDGCHAAQVQISTTRTWPSRGVCYLPADAPRGGCDNILRRENFVFGDAVAWTNSTNGVPVSVRRHGAFRGLVNIMLILL